MRALSSRLRSLRKVVGWGPQRPPTLTANTTRWQCPRGRCRDAYASLLARGRGRALSGARRALGWGGSCLRHTLRATQPPASWQTLPTARSSGRAREGPRSSHRLRGGHRMSPSGSGTELCGASGSAKRRRRRRSTRNSAEGMVTAS